MKSLYVLVAVLFHFSTAGLIPESAREGNEEGRIIGGKPAADGQFPYAAALFYNGNFVCTSSILGPNTVLTAAHCVVLNGELQSADSFYAIANVNKAEPEVRIDFSNVFKHPGYSSDSLNDDLAILTPAQPIPFSQTVKAICIARPNTGINEYSNGTAMGWGNTNRFPGQVTIPDNLQYVEQKIVPNFWCSWVNVGINEKKICGKGFFNGVCNGDSGGPFVHLSANKAPVQIGVASYINGIAGCGSIVPAVWTRVSAYYDFIMQNSVDGPNGGICSL